jgi:fatty-acyl-CoA synthase
VGRPDAHAGEVPVAYVQLQEGSDLTAEKILEHLKKTVGERAAIPKEVILLDEVPLTPVGKIFKPALRWDAIRRVYEAELQALGDTAESVEVKVTEDKVHGCLATIRIKLAAGTSQQEIEEKVESTLTRFTIRYRLEIA